MERQSLYMSNNKVAFVIPAHGEKFHLLYRFLKSFVKYKLEKEVDLYIIFTSTIEYDFFKGKEKDCFIPLFLEDYFDLSICEQNRSFINVKKFLGLKQVFETNRYDYACAFDCDTEIFRRIDLYDIIKNSYEKREIFSTICKHPFLNRIYDSCFRFFNEEEIGYLKERLTDDNGFCKYFWFNNLPIYKREDYLEFYKRIDLNDISWFDFDYILYVMYCLLYKNFKIKDLTYNIKKDSGEIASSFLERNSRMNNKQYKWFLYRTGSLWSRRPIKSRNNFIVIHRDRGFSKNKKRWKRSP
jgi:hypothetical protein